MVTVEVEISADVGLFSVDFGGQCRLFLITGISREGIVLTDNVSVVNWMEGFKLLRWLRK
jgi:hypothetical protein